MAKQRTCGPDRGPASVGRTSRSPCSSIPMVRSRPSAATKKRASRPSPTTQQIAPVGPTSNSSPAGTSDRLEPAHRPASAPASRPANSSSRAEAGGIAHEVTDVATSAIAATMLTVAWAVTDAQ